jgi:hypothetical protein
VAVVNLHITHAQNMKIDYSRFSLGGLQRKHIVTQLLIAFRKYAYAHNKQ